MAKDNVTDWDTDPNENTDIGGISLDGTVMRPSAVDNAFREMMAQIASWQRTTITRFNSSGTWTKPTGCKFVRLKMVGGGGGGGGVDGQGAGTGAVGGPGASGEYVESDMIDVSAIASATVTIGAGGTSGTGVGGANGGNGGSTIWDDGTNTLTANGGNGGAGLMASSDYPVQCSGAGNVGSSGLWRVRGQPGSIGLCSSAIVIQGTGGPGPFGGGGPPERRASNGAYAGTAGQANSGGGASGASVKNSDDNAGGNNGGSGLLIVEEFY